MIHTRSQGSPRIATSLNKKGRASLIRLNQIQAHHLLARQAHQARQARQVHYLLARQAHHLLSHQAHHLLSHHLLSHQAHHLLSHLLLSHLLLAHHLLSHQAHHLLSHLLLSHLLLSHRLLARRAHPKTIIPTRASPFTFLFPPYSPVTFAPTRSHSPTAIPVALPPGACEPVVSNHAPTKWESRYEWPIGIIGRDQGPSCTLATASRS